MMRISRYIISFVVLLSVLRMQYTPAMCNEQDTTRIYINPMKGIRIGVDFSKFLYPFIYNWERTGFEATADMHIKKNLFGAVEAGWLYINLNRTDYLYKQYGFYGKFGIDYNLLKQKVPGSNDILYGGVRYGFSTFNQQAEQITITSHYWQDATGQTIPLTFMTSHWLEFLLGVKAEVLKNFYVGMSFRLKFRVIKPKDDFSTPYMIPGYGNGNASTAIGINYCLSYNLHF